MTKGKWQAEDVALGLQGATLRKTRSKVDEALNATWHMQENAARLSDMLDRLERGETASDVAGLSAAAFVPVLPNVLPNVDWEALAQVQPELDPLALIFGIEGLSAAQREAVFDTTGGPLTGVDYTLLGTAVAAGVLLDLLIVASPPLPPGLKNAGTWKALESPVTRLLNEAGGKIRGGALAQWIDGAERFAKAPFDAFPSGANLTPNTHRLHTLGHHVSPLGLATGLADCLNGTVTFFSNHGLVRKAQTAQASAGLASSLGLVVMHWFSDVFTPTSLPASSLNGLRHLTGATPFKHPLSGKSLQGRELLEVMDRRGFKLAHDVVCGTLPFALDTIIDGGSFACDLLYKDYRAHPLKSDRLKVLAHLIVSSENLLKVALSGFNPLLLNTVQIKATMERLLSAR